MAALILLHGVLPVAVILTGAVPAAILLAWLFDVVVTGPSARLGRHLAGGRPAGAGAHAALWV